MRAIFDEILALSRIEGGHMELRSSRFSLDELLSTVTAARAAEKRSKICCLLDPLLPSTISGDSVNLPQALYKPIVNAPK